MVVKGNVRERVSGPCCGYGGCADHHEALKVLKPEFDVCLSVSEQPESFYEFVKESDVFGFGVFQGFGENLCFRFREYVFR